MRWEPRRWRAAPEPRSAPRRRSDRRWPARRQGEAEVRQEEVQGDLGRRRRRRPSTPQPRGDAAEADQGDDHLRQEERQVNSKAVPGCEPSQIAGHDDRAAHRRLRRRPGRRPGTGSRSAPVRRRRHPRRTSRPSSPRSTAAIPRASCCTPGSTARDHDHCWSAR